MFNKKMGIILLLFIVSICAISSVSASDNVTETLAVDDVVCDDVACVIDEDLSAESEDDVVNEDDAEAHDVLASPDDDSSLSATESDEVLSGGPVSYSQYTIDLSDEYEISSTKGGTIVYYLAPYQIVAMNAYSFYFAVYQLVDDEGNYQLVNQSGIFASDTDRAIGNRQYTFNPSSSLTPGVYRLYAVNTYDNKIMDAAVLYIKGNAVISAEDYNSYYDSGAKMTVKVSDKDTKQPLKYVLLEVAYSNGQTEYYLTDFQGQTSFVPALNAGTYTATLSLHSVFDFISYASVKKTVTIKKAPATVNAQKVTGYQGCKVTLKATVKSNGKNVNEGKVTFKINGKSYDANVKNGVATKSIKLDKVKTYAYTATFNANNFEKASASSNAVVKKRTETKIIVKNQNVYRGANKAFYVQVKTKSGKIVSSGKIKIIDTIGVNSKGKAKFYTGMDLNYIKQVGNTVYFKKTVTKTYTVKYTPTSNEYKPCTAKMKITMKYKCTACGSTTSHSHNGMTFIVK